MDFASEISLRLLWWAQDAYQQINTGHVALNIQGIDIIIQPSLNTQNTLWQRNLRIWIWVSSNSLFGIIQCSCCIWQLAFAKYFFRVQQPLFMENTMKVVTTMPSLLHVDKMPMEPKQSLNSWRLMASNQEAVKWQRLVVRPELNRSFWKSGLTVL